ncbi:AvrE-family type 3 secretion system effector [Erwinia piriflorinigrans]|uniref:Putative avirulence protein DspE (DspA) n=1 Tax=Erwinia piriflorinigrans CFBP 5888 TaxID=1161919 RepID=V5Z4K1_9GAMM|nr:AvrE-family type 3 secretion system effector [Erwinia piriflorinigrans]CCG85929.1 putative avirulence protein DspE (DspA) [Erwinia piriflorinigrans CFBP 5888]
MVLKLQGTEHKAAVNIAAHSPVGPGAALQQGSSSSSVQTAAVSLAEEGKNRGKMPKVRQQSVATDGSSAAHQQKRSFSLKGLLGLKKSAKPVPQAQPAATHGKGTTLRDLLAREESATHHEAASPAAARLTRSDGVKRQSVDDMAGRPMVKGDSGGSKEPTQQIQHQLNNFSQMRQNMLSKMDHPSSSGTAAPAHSAPAEITEEDDDSEFQQLHQQRLAREQENPPQPPRLGVATPLAARFQPKLSSIAESVHEGTSTTPPPLQPQSALKGTGADVTPLSMTLDKGKLQLASSNPPALNTLLEQTLGNKDQHYVAHHASSDGSQHLLLDQKGRLFDIKSNGTSYSVLHNSQHAKIKDRLAQGADVAISVDGKSGKVTLSGGAEGHNKMALSQPGDAHRSTLTGIWQHPAGAAQPQGESIRLHDDKIHILHAELGVWQAADKETHSQLSRQGDGKLYALKDSRTLQNLSDNQASEKLVDKIKSFSVSERGQVAILTDTASRHKMTIMPALNAPPESRMSLSLHFADAHQGLLHGQSQIEAQSVAINHGRLIVADSEGKLFSAALPQPGKTELEMKAMPQKALAEHLGNDHQISGFFTDDHGQLNALVKDNFKQQHACPLGDDHQFHPGWNMSDALVIDNQLGLHQVNPEPHEVLNMGREGSLALQEGKLHYFDQLTKGWTGAESDCQQLKKGLDGAAYILKEGEVKRLDINQSTSSIKQGEDNIFSLPHVRNKPEPGSALQGLDKADKAQAMAVIGVNKYLALSEKGDIRSFQIKPGTQQLERPPQTLSREGISGELKDIHVDHEHNLYALNHDGEIFHQSRADWHKGAEGSGWQKMALPQSESALQRLDMNHQHQPVATLADGSQHLLKAGGWHAYTPPERGPLAPETRGSQQVFDRLTQGLKGKVIPGTGVTVKLSAQAGGLSGMEGRKVSSKFADRVRAYVFNPTMTTPRPIKNAAYATQHNWQGRQGLKPLYEMQGALIKQLDAHNVRHNATQPDLHSKLENLDLGEHGAALLNDIKRFGDELEQSATRSATVLGQHQGVLKSSGEVNGDYQPSRSKGLVQSFNVNRSGRDLSQSLQQAVRAAPPSAQSKLEKVLDHFVSAGINMSHQKGEIPLGRQRDPNDKTALTKSRLILDTVTLGELHQLVDKAALVSGHQPDDNQIKQLRQQFDTLREKQYGENPVKHYTDMGFTHHKPLEADYDAVKAFINAFKKEHHGVNLSARTVLQTSGNAELAQKLKDTLLSLDSGESMSFSRAYGGGVSTAFVPSLNKIPVPIVPGAGVTLDRAYNLSFSRTSGGLSVSFGRDGGVSGNVSVATGHDLMPYMTDKKTSAGNASDWLSKKHKISPDFRIGGSLSASVQSTLQNSLKFKLTEDELPDFIHGLTHGTLTPAELLQKGVEHQMKQGSKLVFSVDTSAALDLRAGINLTEDGSKPNSVTARASIGVSASANLVSGSRERSTTAGEFGNTAAASNNRPTFFNQAGVGANATLAAGVAHSSTHDGKPVGTFPAFTSANVSVALAMDNRTSQSISLEMKRAEPVTSHEIDTLASTLGKHFKDSTTTQMLAAFKELKDAKPAEKLSILNTHFSERPIVGDDRYEAVRGLKKLVSRQQAADSNSTELGSASHSTTYKNLSRVSHDGIFELLNRHINAALPPSSASRLSALMDNDPALKGLIKQLQSTPFSSASVAMELKDDLRDQTEKAILDGKVGREEVGILFQDRNNLRIKSVSVSQAVSKSEGFNTPTLLLGANNSAGVSMERNIGTINFKYGQDQNTPRRFTLEGEIAKANPQVASALSELKKEGLEMKS